MIITPSDDRERRVAWVFPILRPSFPCAIAKCVGVMYKAARYFKHTHVAVQNPAIVLNMFVFGIHTTSRGHSLTEHALLNQCDAVACLWPKSICSPDLLNDIESTMSHAQRGSSRSGAWLTRKSRVVSNASQLLAMLGATFSRLGTMPL